MTGTRTIAALATVPVALVVIVTLVAAGGGHQAQTGQPKRPPDHTDLNDNAVPDWAREPLHRAATTCPDITAPILAAQIETESNWNTDAYNPHSHATGLAQFIPATWTTWGTDGNNDGHTDPRNPLDAITSQADYLCHLINLIKNNPHLTGDTIDLALAAYNAGPGNVKKYTTIPPFPETTNYITKIRTLAATKYAASHDTVPAASTTQAVIQKAREHVGRTMYAWGGGTLNGPSPGTALDTGTIGFDCSSLTRYAYYQGTNHTITLPRTAQEQYNATKTHPIPTGALQPGDLLFWGTTPANIHHVALYAGNNRMIEAPRSGQLITETTIRTTGDYTGATRVLAEPADM